MGKNELKLYFIGWLVLTCILLGQNYTSGTEKQVEKIINEKNPTISVNGVVTDVKLINTKWCDEYDYNEEENILYLKMK